MPYVKTSERELLDQGTTPLTAGQLTYVLYRACLDYVGRVPSFQAYAEAIGALEAAKLELYRRHVSRYEDKKIAEHGDVE